MTAVKTKPRKRTQSPAIPALSARERNKLDKRERIRDAAFALFLAEGFEAATMAQVAARAEVAKGTLFLYASDKDDLLCMVMHDRLRETVDRLFATLPRRGDLLVQLLHLFGGLFEMYGEHPALALSFIRVFPTARGPNGQVLRAMTLGFLHRLSELVREAAVRGEVSADVPAMQAAHNLFALYFAALLAGVSGHVPSIPAARDAVLRGSLELQLRGLRP
ncbi:MAG: TetR/AcrR family transcriptional regulator [Myxococcales bacterium]